MLQALCNAFPINSTIHTTVKNPNLRIISVTSKEGNSHQFENYGQRTSEAVNGIIKLMP